jgi:hypothetical protein
MAKKTAKRTERRSLLTRWGRLKPGERAILIALLGLIGVLVAGVVGGLFGVLASIAPGIFAGDIPGPPDELNLAALRINDWQLGSLYGVPSASTPPPPAALEDWEAQREVLYSDGFHILYFGGDFTSVNAQLPALSEARASTLSSETPYPIVPIELELWNLSRTVPAVLEEITIRLNSYEPANPPDLKLYYLVIHGLGGGGDLPTREFDALLSQSRTELSLLRQHSTRIQIDEGEALVVRLNTGFQDPGTYSVGITISYHYPGASPMTIDSPTLSYSWLSLDFVDGTQVTVLK